MSASLLPLPNPTALGHVLAAIEDGALAGAALDARIHDALGWLVMRGTDGRLSIRNPGGRQWLRMPTPSRDEAAAFGLMPQGWHHGVAVRDRILAWCADPAEPAARFFECFGRSRALAVTRAALHAQRSIALLPRLAQPPASCRCGWQGPGAALRLGRCPDCARTLLTTTAPESQHAPA